ncbi:DNA/RNA non-specific endonuclease [Vibrio anguillarum]|uniref:DNA/RNA non-specific endonuclease n=2 Tax=Vibrio anguillarum TaxID=55601 RepID=A0ABR9Z7E0_VIBAN|nr:DNA/RNA non-specific endonuclease [Vibrio anguillarum]MBF4374386.1 DNA/RNA non-specific endonuclease [Vibrio anguillarum]
MKRTIPLMLLLVAGSVNAEMLEIQYKKFTIILDCDTKSAVEWHYVATKDEGNAERLPDFYFDPNVPSRCQQTSTKTYKNRKGMVKYDRGHLTPANAMDGSKQTIAQSNIMTNVLPQAAVMNRGAWLMTERYVECRRDNSPVTVIGGVFVGTTPPDGDFRLSHGVVAPEAFWKVAYFANDIIAWWVPNSSLATAEMIDSYIVSVEEIERRIGKQIEVPIFLKDKTQLKTNAITSNCDLS